MARMRSLKARLKLLLSSEGWEASLPQIVAMGDKAVMGPLFSLLLLGEPLAPRAAVALGVVVAAMAESHPESARNIVRRCMWHMNEDSGNLGWGIPEAFAEILARSPLLFREFHKVLVSYIMDTGTSDNYCDYAPLRSSCYWAVGRLCQVDSHITPRLRAALEQGLHDEDALCRSQAAWALQQCSEQG